MAVNFSGTSQYYMTAIADGSPVSAIPVTMACWANVDTDVTAFAMGIAESTGITDYYALFHVITTKLASFRSVVSSVNVDATSSSGLTTGTWSHLLGIDIAAASRIVYVDGGNTGTNVSDQTTAPVGMERVGIGTRANSAHASSEWNGDLYAAAIWNAELAAHEVAALANGVSPLRVRRASLVFFSALDTLTPTDIAGGRALTATGSPTMAQDPPNFMRGPLRGRSRRAA